MNYMVGIIISCCYGMHSIVWALQLHYILITTGSYEVSSSDILFVFYRPVPMESVVLCEAHIESVQGRKVYCYAEMKGHDGVQLYSTAKCLCVTVNGILWMVYYL